MPFKPSYLAAALIVASVACNRSENAVPADSTTTVSDTTPAEYVAISPIANGEGRVVSVCPSYVQRVADGREYVQLRSEVKREAPTPADSMRVTSAVASYIRRAHRLDEIRVHDTLNLNCQTMRRI